MVIILRAFNSAARMPSLHGGSHWFESSSAYSIKIKKPLDIRRIRVRIHVLIKTNLEDKKVAKQAIQVDKIELQSVIEKLEKENTFQNRSALWSAVEETEFAKNCNPRPLTGQVAMLLAKKWNINISTPLGKRGFTSGNVPKNTVKKKRISLKTVAFKVPEQYEPVLNKLKNGSLKAAIKLKCLECSNWTPKEIRECPVVACPLYVVRPYRNNKNTE